MIEGLIRTFNSISRQPLQRGPSFSRLIYQISYHNLPRAPLAPPGRPYRRSAQRSGRRPIRRFHMDSRAAVIDESVAMTAWSAWTRALPPAPRRRNEQLGLRARSLGDHYRRRLQVIEITTPCCGRWAGRREPGGLFPTPRRLTSSLGGV